MRVAKWLGGILLAGGLLVPVGYAVSGVFTDPEVPLGIKVALPAAGLGLLVLLGAALYEGAIRRRGEHLEEVEH